MVDAAPAGTLKGTALFLKFLNFFDKWIWPPQELCRGPLRVPHEAGGSRVDMAPAGALKGTATDLRVQTWNRRK